MSWVTRRRLSSLMSSQPSEEGPELESSNEENFMAAIYDGDIATFMEFLNSREKCDLNLEYKDSNGNTPLQACIQEGYSVMVNQLLIHNVYVGDAMLRAVDVGFNATVKTILDYASTLTTFQARQRVLDCHCDDDDFHPDVTPIVLAAQRNDFAAVTLLLSAGCKIVDVASKDFSTSAKNALQQSVGTLEMYKGLASEAYAALAMLDPVDYAFVLSDKLQKLSKIDVPFKSSYLELADSLNHLSTEIISYARDTVEILTVLSYHERKGKGDKDNAALGPLPKLARAIEFNQRQFVAHPNCQQTVKSKFYGRLSYLRDHSTLNRLLVFLTVLVTFPALSFLYLCLSKLPWIKNTIGCPYIKFTMHLASDVFFVCLLTADTFVNRGVHPAIDILGQPTRILLLLWVIGFGWQITKAIIKKKINVVNMPKHLRNTFLVMFFLIAIVIDAVYIPPEIQEQSVQETKRDVVSHQFPLHPEGTFHSLQRSNHTNDSIVLVDQQHVLHRISNIVTNLRKIPGSNSGSPEADDYIVTNEAYIEYLEYDTWHPLLIARCLFAVATVLSLLRMLPYVVVSDTIGPIQISLGSMVWQTLHFFVVIAVIFAAFSLGMTYIYSYHEEVQLQICVKLNGAVDRPTCPTGQFADFLSSIAYLYWSVFGLVELDALNLDPQARILQTTGYLLYSVFTVVFSIVLLNMLIAVMSNVYNDIEENADVEWKFATTSMWMRFIDEGDVVPPPLNVLPSVEHILLLFARIKQKCQCRQARRSKGRKTEPSKARHEESQYQRVIARLVERFVTAKTAGEVSVEAGVTVADIRALRNDLLSLKFDMFQRIQDNTIDIRNTIEKGVNVKHKSETANAVFTQTEQIHTMVGAQVGSLFDFKTTLDRKVFLLQKDKERIMNDRSKLISALDLEGQYLQRQTRRLIYSSFPIEQSTQTEHLSPISEELPDASLPSKTDLLIGNECAQNYLLAEDDYQVSSPPVGLDSPRSNGCSESKFLNADDLCEESSQLETCPSKASGIELMKNDNGRMESAENYENEATAFQTKEDTEKDNFPGLTSFMKFAENETSNLKEGDHHEVFTQSGTSSSRSNTFQKARNEDDLGKEFIQTDTISSKAAGFSQIIEFLKHEYLRLPESAESETASSQASGCSGTEFLPDMPEDDLRKESSQTETSSSKASGVSEMINHENSRAASAENLASSSQANKDTARFPLLKLFKKPAENKTNKLKEDDHHEEFLQSRVSSSQSNGSLETEFLNEDDLRKESLHTETSSSNGRGDCPQTTKHAREESVENDVTISQASKDTETENLFMKPAGNETSKLKDDDYHEVSPQSVPNSFLANNECLETELLNEDELLKESSQAETSSSNGRGVFQMIEFPKNIYAGADSAENETSFSQEHGRSETEFLSDREDDLRKESFRTETSSTKSTGFSQTTEFLENTDAAHAEYAEKEKTSFTTKEDTETENFSLFVRLMQSFGSSQTDISSSVHTSPETMRSLQHPSPDRVAPDLSDYDIIEKDDV